MTRPKTRLRERLREKVRRGWCRKNLHRLVGDNVGWHKRPNGKATRRCLACERQQRAAQRRAVMGTLGYRYVRCIVRGCDANTERPSGSPPYICRIHRQRTSPPGVA